jgi:5-methyltetrahydropteroyltriglutamate--homocysteine methyltransferase
VRIAERDVLLPTTMVGSWPRPLWLRGAVLRESPTELDYLDMYQRTLYEDAVRLCVKDQDLAGLDIVTDGNQYFQGETRYDKVQMLLVPLRLQGFRGYGPPGETPGTEAYFRPVVAERIRWVRPIFGPVLAAMRQATEKPFKININSGPATVATWCEDRYYGDAEALRADIADAFNTELRWLAKHGAPAIQLTEQSFLASGGRETWPVELMNRAAAGVGTHLAWHMCYGNARDADPAYPELNAGCLRDLFASEAPIDWSEIHLETARAGMTEMELLKEWTARGGEYLGIGVIEVRNPHVESPEEVATRIRMALEAFEAERLVVSTDCGLYQLPRELAFRKLCALVVGTRQVRRELGRQPDGTEG